VSAATRILVIALVCKWGSHHVDLAIMCSVTSIPSPTGHSNSAVPSNRIPLPSIPSRSRPPTMTNTSVPQPFSSQFQQHSNSQFQEPSSSQFQQRSSSYFQNATNVGIHGGHFITQSGPHLTIYHIYSM